MRSDYSPRMADLSERSTSSTPLRTDSATSGLPPISSIANASTCERGLVPLSCSKTWIARSNTYYARTAERASSLNSFP